MSNKLLSIIVPFYNVEKYIGQCLDSLYNQDLPEEDYEVICVNDCSPDRSREIVIEYQKKHSNLVLIEHVINKMLGAARNTGLEAARGKYIWFVDSDDFIENYVIQKLIAKCENNKLDLLLFNVKRFNNNNTYIQNNFFTTDSTVYSGVDYLLFEWGEDFLSNYNGSVCNRIYRRDFLLEEGILFRKNVFWEDVHFSLRAFLLSKKAMSISDIIYNYRVNPNSIMNTRDKLTTTRIILHSSLILGYDLLILSEEIASLNSVASGKIKEGSIWHINNFTKGFIKLNIAQKLIFYQELEKHPKIYHRVQSELSNINKFITKHKKLNLLIFTIINPLIFFYEKYKKFKHI